MLRNTSPLWDILRNWFSVVALWKVATFSLTKNVSGTQMSRMYSAPTTSFSIPKLDPLNMSLLSLQNCLKYMSKVKSMNFSERSPMERMYRVTPTVTGGPGNALSRDACQFSLNIKIFHIDKIGLTKFLWQTASLNDAEFQKVATPDKFFLGVTPCCLIWLKRDAIFNFYMYSKIQYHLMTCLRNLVSVSCRSPLERNLIERIHYHLLFRNNERHQLNYEHR